MAQPPATFADLMARGAEDEAFYRKNTDPASRRGIIAAEFPEDHQGRLRAIERIFQEWCDLFPLPVDAGSQIAQIDRRNRDEQQHPELRRQAKARNTFEVHAGTPFASKLTEFYHDVKNGGLSDKAALVLTIAYIGDDHIRNAFAHLLHKRGHDDTVAVMKLLIAEQMGEAWTKAHGEHLLACPFPIFYAAIDQAVPEDTRALFVSLNVRVLEFGREYHAQSTQTQGGAEPECLSRPHPFNLSAEAICIPKTAKIWKMMAEADPTAGGDFFANLISDNVGRQAIDLTRVEQAFLFLFGRLDKMERTLASRSNNTYNAPQNNRRGRGGARGGEAPEGGAMMPFNGDGGAMIDNRHFGQYPAAPEMRQQIADQRRQRQQYQQQQWAVQDQHWAQYQHNVVPPGYYAQQQQQQPQQQPQQQAPAQPPARAPAGGNPPAPPAPPQGKKDAKAPHPAAFR